MKRREFISLLGGAAAAWPIASRAQGKAVRLVYLAELSPEATPRLWNLLREELRSHGWTEGTNLTITPRWGAQLSDALARELGTLKPDAIVAWATPAVTAAQRATKSIPIVMVGVADPVAAGFIDGLARPGGNITGTTNLSRDLGGKLLELLDELVPSLASVTVLKNPRNPASTFQFREISDASQHLNRQVVSIDVSTDAELDNAFIRMKRENAKAAVALADPFFFSTRARIADLARDARLPVVFSRRENVEAGGLLSYGPSLTDQFRVTADYVDKILRGAKPKELPVQQPTQFELVINLKTAKAIGLEIPPRLLTRADEVIE
ncbi:MAG TPA: ABC transporter substrate-binding protein [Pseudolabrys sp.]|jgi:putative ABC transport system substrate-binding protein